MANRLLTPKILIPIIFGGLLLGCSAISCLGSIAILVPPAADRLQTSVVSFSIILIIIAPILLLIGAGTILYFGFLQNKTSETGENK